MPCYQLGTTAQAEPIKLIGMVKRLSSSLFPDYDTECTIVASSSAMDKYVFKEYFQPQQEEHAIIIADTAYLASHKDTLSDFLKKHTGCAVGTFQMGTQHMKDLIYVLRKVGNNFILKLDGIAPMMGNMASSHYPIIWIQKQIQPKGESSTILGLFCPKEDKSKSEILRVQLAQYSEIKCPHYLKGQSLGLGHIYRAKPRMIDGKAVYGEEYVRFFEYASKKFKFKPWFRLGRVMYFPKNESWGGLQGEVSV